MLKPNEVRQIITKANDYLKTNPDKLQVFIDSGHIACTGAKSLSYEYNYTLTVLIQDFPEHADIIILPLLIYLRTHQPELFENPNKNKEIISFDIEFLNQETIDLMLKINLTERVIVMEDEGNKKLKAHHLPEPSHPDLPDQDIHIDVYDRVDGTKLGEVFYPAWQVEF